MWYAAWHCNIAIHEIGHYLAAVKTNNLRPELAAAAEKKLKQGTLGRWLWYLEMFVKIPYGAFEGVNKEAGSFHPAVKTQNLAVSAAGPKASKVLSPDHLSARNHPDRARSVRRGSRRGLRGKAPVHDWRGCSLRFPAVGRGKVQGVPEQDSRRRRPRRRRSGPRSRPTPCKKGAPSNRPSCGAS